MKHSEYFSKREKRKETFLRVYLGVNELKQHPHKCIMGALIVAFFVCFLKVGKHLISLSALWASLDVIQYGFYTLIVIALVLCLLVWVKQVGYLTAREDEANVSLAFKELTSKYGYPVLVSKKKNETNGVTTREFYSHIPLYKWEEAQKDIEAQMNLRVVKSEFINGGKYNNDSYRIKFKSLPSTKFPDRGILYDN